MRAKIGCELAPQALSPLGDGMAHLVQSDGQGAHPVEWQGLYKEGKGTPEPLLLVRHAGLGGIDDFCRETLALTKMDNDGPYDRLPVTLNFAGTLATIVKRMPKLASILSSAPIHVIGGTAVESPSSKG